MPNSVLSLPRINDVPPLAKARDIRHLVQCGSCGGVGDDRRMLSGLDIFGTAGWHHGKCVELRLSEAELLALPAAATGRLRLNETGRDLMMKLLDRNSPHSDVVAMPKLTAKQQVLLDYLKAGWRLGCDQCLSNFKLQERPPFVHRRTIAGLKIKGVLVYEMRNARYVLTDQYN
jgi:hypothetical protein